MSDWPFEQPPNLAGVTTRSIVEGDAWIAHVSHDTDDGGWQFHDSHGGEPRIEDAMLVSLRSMVDREPALLELADLPEGWRASRDGPATPWRRGRRSDP